MQTGRCATGQSFIMCLAGFLAFRSLRGASLLRSSAELCSSAYHEPIFDGTCLGCPRTAREIAAFPLWQVGVVGGIDSGGGGGGGGPRVGVMRWQSRSSLWMPEGSAIRRFGRKTHNPVWGGRPPWSASAVDGGGGGGGRERLDKCATSQKATGGRRHGMLTLEGVERL